MATYIFLILGIIFLVKGADLLVDGGSSLAKKLNVSNLVIGLTIVAFGTSAPELVVNIFSSLNDKADIAMGNIIGSNISNILLIGGVAAMIYPIKLRDGAAWKEISLSLVAIALLLFMANDQIINKNGVSVISKIDGIILISLFMGFLYYTFGKSKAKSKDDTDYETFGWETSIIYIIIGVAGLTIGGQWIINSATEISRSLGLSEALIGLTVLAVGTSLPELATAAVAAFKKNADLAIGNIVGSNIFNVFFVVGISATIKPLPFNLILNTDILIAIGATLLLYWFIHTGKKTKHIERWEGVTMFCCYLTYMAFLVWRG
jgi:cation:H+ antiporter